METTNTTPDWAALSGTPLNEEYALAELLEQSDARATFRVTARSGAEVQARAVLLRAEGAGEQAEAWTRAQGFRDPHLGSLLATGRAADTDLLYAVTEGPDETLDSVLKDRALDAEEAGEVLRGLLSALGEIHEHGFVHGAISPDQVFAVGNLVKLSSVSAKKAGQAGTTEVVPVRYYAPESGGENRTPEADVWCLGATLFEILTQRKCGPGSRGEAGQLAAPFSAIVDGCLNPDPRARITLSAVVATERGETIKAPAPVPDVPSHPAVSAGESSFAERKSGELRPGAESWKAPSTRPLSRPKWIYAVLGLGVLLIVFLAVELRNTASPNKSSSESAATPAAAAPANSAPASPSHAGAAGGAAAPSIVAGTANAPLWRVVMYTYGKQDAAEARANALNEKHQNLDAKVFAPNVGRGPYLVVAGDGMSRDQAVEQRRRVVGMGMPHDTYIEKYSR